MSETERAEAYRICREEGARAQTKKKKRRKTSEKVKRHRKKQKLYLFQEGLCAICSTWMPDVKAAHYDHNHATGVYRSLLCRNCNLGLGFFQDSAQILEWATAYLWTHGSE